MPATGLVRCLNDILPTPSPPNPPERSLHKGQELGSWNVTVSSVPGPEPAVWQRVKERPPRTEALTLRLRTGQEGRGLRDGKWFFSRSHSEQVGESQNCTAFKSATSHFAVPTTGSAGRTEG